MDMPHFDRLVASFVANGNRRGLLALLAALPLLVSLAVITDEEGAAAKKKRKKRKKKCAKAGQPTSNKRKRCCAGLVMEASGLCAAPPSNCAPATCPPTACGSVPDGCGGTLTCSCPANHLCLQSGLCQPCTVTCTGPSIQCGTALQTALNGGGTLYVCSGRYVGNFTIFTGVRVIGAGDGDDPASNTILDVGGPGPVLVINSGVAPVELERLRLTDSNPSQPGGGIEHGGTMLRMTACTISGSSTAIGGGGITASGILEMTECTVSGNSGGSFGGGISAGGTLTMTRCTVRDNHATGIHGHGGGIYANGPTTTLTDCLIEGNDASGGGGGLYVAATRATLLGTTEVRGNAAEFGGGISVSGGALIIAETCRVMENMASLNNGGGIYNDGGAVSLQGANPSPIVVNNCHENCAGNVPKCAVAPVSCPP